MPATEFDLLVVGELNCDLILSGDTAPAFGQVEKLIDDAVLTIGSSSAIFACGAARLGLKVAFIGKVGNDDFGRFMLRELSARGIDTSGVVIDPTLKTGLTVILSRGTDRALLTYKGTIAALCYDDIDLGYLQRARHLHIGSYFLLDSLRADVPKLFDNAHASGLTISIDTNYDPSERWDDVEESLRRTDIFLPNETELCAIAQTPSVETALSLIGSYVPFVVVKQGELGATVLHGANLEHVAAMPISVVDTTGAGDSFDAGFIYGYLAGWELSRTLKFASICGALSTRAAGGTTAQATLDEASAYL